MSRLTVEQIVYAFRSLIKSSELNTNISAIRAAFADLEIDFDQFVADFATALGNGIITDPTVTVASGMTVNVGDFVAFLAGHAVAFADLDPVIVTTPGSGSCIAAIMADYNDGTPQVIVVLGDTATPTVPPVPAADQTIIRTIPVTAGQADLLPGNISTDYEVLITDWDQLDAARRSAVYGPFATLDARFENIEGLTSALGVEMEAARVSTLYGSFASLLARLENIESEVKAMDFRPGSKAVSQLSGANSANTITLAAQVGKVHKIFGYLCMIKDAASVSSIDITITDDGVVVWSDGIKVATPINDGAGFAFAVPIQSVAANKAIVISATAGGSSVKTQLSVFYDTIDA